VPDRGLPPDVAALELKGPELAPVEELLGRYRRYLLVERDLEPLTVVG
jgi:hypothetical protein